MNQFLIQGQREPSSGRFFRYWNLAGEIVSSGHGSLSERVSLAWARALCCIGYEEVPSTHLEAFLTVRHQYLPYRFQVRRASEAAALLPQSIAEKLTATLLGQEPGAELQVSPIRSV